LKIVNLLTRHLDGVKCLVILLLHDSETIFEHHTYVETVLQIDSKFVDVVDEFRVDFGNSVVGLLQLGSTFLLALPLHLVELHHAEFYVLDHGASVEFSLVSGAFGAGDLGHIWWLE